MDYSVKVLKLPQKGETILADSFYTAAGGKGANQAVAARRLGAEVYMIAAVGNDSNGKELCDKLELEGIKTQGIKKVDTPTGNAMITVDHSGSNTIVVFPGANGQMDKDWLMHNIGIIEEADFVILQLEIPMETVKAAVQLAKGLDKKIILNPAPAVALPDELYKDIDIITPNETELAVLTGKEDFLEGAKQLIHKGVNSVIVTLGDKGCLYLDKNTEIYSDSFQVNAIDTTAAGDSFNGAISVALAEGMPIEKALKFSNATGAITTTRLGAQEALPFRNYVEEFLKFTNE